MALAEALSKLCPQATSGMDLTDCDLTLLPRNGKGLGVPCHEVLLRARCSSLPKVVDRAIQVNYNEAVIYALLRWIYCEKLDKTVEIDHSTGLSGIGLSLLELAQAWGLHDVTCLRERLTASWRTCKRPGSLAEDLLRAYDARQLGGRFQFLCVNEDGAEVASAPIYGGWPLVLRACSSYFNAMLGGAWSESNTSDSGDMVQVKVCWPREQLARLLRFMHGACFVAGPGDLQAAAICSDFFGVPSLVAHAHDWMSTHLRVTNAASLWCFLESEPRLWLHSAEKSGYGDIGSDFQACADADEACFDFHIKHFGAMAAGLEEEEMRIPLHELSRSLMRRIMGSGLVSMPKEALMEVVEQYALAKCGCKDKEYTELCDSLRPPAALFNRAHRDMLMGGVAASIRTVL